MDKDSPILDRLYRNHIAVISHILGESDKEASRAVLFKNALEDIYRFQVYEKSDHPIAVMEKRLAMGLSA
jgi:hypothetical protein